MLYDIINSEGIESYKWNYGANLLIEQKVLPWKYPTEWHDMNGKQICLRMSALTDNKDNTYILLLHHKDMQTLHYSYYCMYLDRTTLLPVSYIPFPVLTSLAVRIVFVMQIIVDERHLYFCKGVSDEVSGVASCNKQQWEQYRTLFLST